MTRYYLIGTPMVPLGVIRFTRGSTEPVERFNPDTNAWRPAPEMGRYIYLGDTMLDDLPEDKVEAVIQRLRGGWAPERFPDHASARTAARKAAGQSYMIAEFSVGHGPVEPRISGPG